MRPVEPGVAPAARRLMRACRSAAVATSMPDGGGSRPYAALVTVACAADGSPLLLLSGLSEHTRNLAAEPRAALLFEAASRRRNPQTGPRVTVLGRIEPTSRPQDSRRFLARHPDAALYAGFGDFGFYRMAVERAHYVGGFARAEWIDGARLVLASETAAAVEAEEDGVLAHMNEDHAGTLALLAQELLGRSPGAWRLTGVDPDGIDLAVGAGFARLDFDRLAENAADIRTLLVELAASAREPS